MMSFKTVLKHCIIYIYIFLMYINKFIIIFYLKNMSEFISFIQHIMHSLSFFKTIKSITVFVLFICNLCFSSNADIVFEKCIS